MPWSHQLCKNNTLSDSLRNQEDFQRARYGEWLSGFWKPGIIEQLLNYVIVRTLVVLAVVFLPNALPDFLQHLRVKNIIYILLSHCIQHWFDITMNLMHLFLGGLNNFANFCDDYSFVLVIPLTAYDFVGEIVSLQFDLQVPCTQDIFMWSSLSILNRNLIVMHLMYKMSIKMHWMVSSVWSLLHGWTFQSSSPLTFSTVHHQFCIMMGQ